MHIRIGALVVSVNFIFLMFAGTFFIIISYKNIYPLIIVKKSQAVISLFFASCGGFVGGWLNGFIGMVNGNETSALPPSIIQFNFGSFGGFWGVIAGIMLFGIIYNISPLIMTDAIIPGILIGGSVARIGDYFTNSSYGITLNIFNIQWFQPFKPWYCYDIVALLFIFFLIKIFLRINRYREIKGLKLLMFLLGYGLIRFMLEFFRDTVHLYGPFTYGQLMASIQIMLGFIVLYWIKGSHIRNNRFNLS